MSPLKAQINTAITKRLFIAIAVTLYDYDALRRQFDPLVEGKWREESTLHCTLAFLGEQFAPEEVIHRLETVAWKWELSKLEGWGYFDSSRVFVLTTRNSSLQSLRECIEKALELPHETLNPHVTLMRVKRLRDADTFRNTVQSPSSSPLGQLQQKVGLYQSTLLENGARYELLYEWINSFIM